MPTPAPPRTRRTRRAVALTAVLSVALTAGLILGAGPTLSAAAAPDNPLAPEITTPEQHPAGSRVEKKLAQLEKTVPAAVRPTATRRVAAPAPTSFGLALPISSSKFEAYSYPACASTGRPATVRAAVLSKKSRTLSWVLTNGGGITKTGKIRVKGSKSKLTEFSVAGLPAGPYRLDFRKSGSSKLSVRVPVLVLTCAQATATCRGITFANPASNPAVDVDFYPADDEDEGDGGFFLLDRGASRFVRTDSAAVTWSAYGTTEATESSAGEADSLAVPQDCDPPDSVPGDFSLTSYVLADCRRAGAATAQLELGFERVRGLAVSFEVRNAAGVVVLHGDVPPSDEAVGALPGPGNYRFLTYVDGVAYEDVPLTVLECIRVTRTCKSATFTNLNLGRIDVGYATKTGKHFKQIVLAGKTATKVKWKYKDLRWIAFPAGTGLEGDELETQIFTAAGDGLLVRPTDC